MSELDLPSPDTVTDHATTVAAETRPARDTSDTLDIAIAEPPSTASVTQTDTGYDGPGAGHVGQLAATTQAVADAGGILHYPDPDPLTTGPWLVIEPLAGQLATVAKGSATITIELSQPTGHLDARNRSVTKHLATILEATRPQHDRYPVDRDEFEAFTPGLPTIELDTVSHDDSFTVTLSVKTVPDTTPTDLHDRFATLDPTESVTVTTDHGIERATPPTTLQTQAETALETVLGDWTYEWLPGPSLFTQIPSQSKLALGTATPGHNKFEENDGEALYEILTHILDQEVTTDADDR